MPIINSLTPREIVEHLNLDIIGQDSAKKAVATTLRSRERRLQLSPELRDEITPKNILMIGPTGVGKTEIARRVAKLNDKSHSPFIKVEATKFTEVGYVGRDVDSIIRDLTDIAFKQLRQTELTQVAARAETAAEERVLDALLPTPTKRKKNASATEAEATSAVDDAAAKLAARQALRERLRAGELNEQEIEIDLSAAAIGVEIMGPPGMEEMTSQLQNMFQNLHSDRTRARRLKISEALKTVREEEASKLLNEEELKARAVTLVEQHGIVFIDEIDKVCRRSEQSSNADVSREGVQRDLLPLIEGCAITTKYGTVHTDHILFIASGAFHLAKPSDLIPELQGRLPVRVELNALTAQDFERILTEPKTSLTKQYIALMATEALTLEFAESAIKRIAEIAWQVNENTENIGARRLHTVLERLLEDISFNASECSGTRVVIDADYVDQHLKALAKDEDLSHFIL